MLLHITQRSEGALAVVALAGHVVREGGAELERLCQAGPSPVALVLTDLRWIDAAGITLLNTLADAGAQRRAGA
jgi:hypothetical protein